MEVRVMAGIFLGLLLGLLLLESGCERGTYHTTIRLAPTEDLQGGTRSGYCNICNESFQDIETHYLQHHDIHQPDTLTFGKEKGK